jgi:hypothetical protein
MTHDAKRADNISIDMPPCPPAVRFRPLSRASLWAIADSLDERVVTRVICSEGAKRCIISARRACNDEREVLQDAVRRRHPGPQAD